MEFHAAPYLALEASELAQLGGTRIATLLYQAGDQAALVLSVTSLLNHSRSPNVSFRADLETETIRFTAAENIPAGAELLIDYGGFARTLNLP